jgi:hypothetical protein
MSAIGFWLLFDLKEYINISLGYYKDVWIILQLKIK